MASKGAADAEAYTPGAKQQQQQGKGRGKMDKSGKGGQSYTKAKKQEHGGVRNGPKEERNGPKKTRRTSNGSTSGVRTAQVQLHPDFNPSSVFR